MKSPTRRRGKHSGAPEQQLKSFIARFDPKHQAVIRKVRAALRKRLKTAHELVYDNYNFFVIGYSPTERPSDSILSIAAAANGVGLCFIHGASLPDPKRILLGSGKQTRFVRLPSAAVLDDSDVVVLVDAAVRQSRVPFRSAGASTLVIRSVSARQKARRRSQP